MPITRPWMKLRPGRCCYCRGPIRLLALTRPRTLRNGTTVVAHRHCDERALAELAQLELRRRLNRLRRALLLEPTFDFRLASLREMRDVLEADGVDPRPALVKIREAIASSRDAGLRRACASEVCLGIRNRCTAPGSN